MRLGLFIGARQRKPVFLHNDVREGNSRRYKGPVRALNPLVHVRDLILEPGIFRRQTPNMLHLNMLAHARILKAPRVSHRNVAHSDVENSELAIDRHPDEGPRSTWRGSLSKDPDASAGATTTSPFSNGPCKDFVYKRQSIVYEIRHYLAPDQRGIYLEWHRKLRDTKARVAVDRSIYRIELGNFGDHKFCRDGVWELRVDVGPGYRVYCALAGTEVILLLCAGDKRTQQADTDRACEYWQDWQRRAER